LFPVFKSAYTKGTRAVAPFTVRLSQRRGGHLPTGVAWTMDDAAADHGRMWVSRPEEVLHRPVPEGVPARHPVFVAPAEEVVPRVGVLELDGGRVLSPHSVVITGQNRFVREMSWYFGTTRPREHPIFLNPRPPAPTHVPGRLGVLASRGDANYYHFLHDCLPRISVLEQCPDVAPVDAWYVARRSRFQRELLDLMGIPEDQVVDSAAVPHVRAATLVVPGLPSDVERNPPWVNAFLRERLKPADVDRIPGRRIYLPRRAGRHNRQVRNEDEVIARLRRRGFELVDPGELPVIEQIRTFGEADVIVAPHGAALANLAFCSPGSALLELFPAQSFVADYWKMAAGVPGLEYQYLGGAGRAAGTSRARFVTADITVDLPQLERMVDQILDRHPA
jgi:capsular polysaccharide biosynthesis protein